MICGRADVEDLLMDARLALGEHREAIGELRETLAEIATAGMSGHS